MGSTSGTPTSANQSATPIDRWLDKTKRDVTMSPAVTPSKHVITVAAEIHPTPPMLKRVASAPVTRARVYRMKGTQKVSSKETQSVPPDQLHIVGDESIGLVQREDARKSKETVRVFGETFTVSRDPGDIEVIDDAEPARQSGQSSSGQSTSLLARKTV